MPSNFRAPDFKYIPAGAIGIRFTDNDATLIFGVEEQAEEKQIFEQIGVVMTHKTAKLLLAILQQAITNYEAQTGQEIFLDPEKIERLREAMAPKPRS